MTKRWVVNASPLIILGKISRLELLVALTDELVIPKAVVQEIEQGPHNDPAKLWLAQTGDDFIKDTAPMNSVIAGWDLGAGESHVLTWALANRNFEAILDDLAARRCAQTLSVPVRGTLGVILLAKKSGLIPKIDPLLQDLSSAGLHMDHNILNTIRNLAGE